MAKLLPTATRLARGAALVGAGAILTVGAYVETVEMLARFR